MALNYTIDNLLYEIRLYLSQPEETQGEHAEFLQLFASYTNYLYQSHIVSLQTPPTDLFEIFHTKFVSTPPTEMYSMTNSFYKSLEDPVIPLLKN